MLYHLALITRCCQYNPFGRKFDENRGRHGNNGYGGKEVFVRQCLLLFTSTFRLLEPSCFKNPHRYFRIFYLQVFLDIHCHPKQKELFK